MNESTEAAGKAGETNDHERGFVMEKVKEMKKGIGGRGESVGGRKGGDGEPRGGENRLRVCKTSAVAIFILALKDRSL